MKPTYLWIILVITFFWLNVHAKNVGIGLTTPTAKLHVNGEVTSDSLRQGLNIYDQRVYADEDGVLFVRRTETYSIHPLKFTSSNPSLRFEMTSITP